MANQTRKHFMRSSPEDMRVAKGAPDTDQTRAPAYRLAYDDAEFLCSDDLRPIRLQLELLKPELMLDKQGIKSTIDWYKNFYTLEGKTSIFDISMDQIDEYSAIARSKEIEWAKK